MDEGEKRSIEDKADEQERKRGRKPGLTDSEREARNMELIRDRLRGQSWPYIAEKHGLQPITCQRVFEQWREENKSTYQGRDPLAIVHSMLDRLESWVEQLAEVADSSVVDATKIAAINAQVGTLTRTAELLQACGILPHDLGVLRVQLDVQSLAVKLVTTLNEQGASVELKQAILEALKTEAAALPSGANGDG